jgi:hypothetical protein
MNKKLTYFLFNKLPGYWPKYTLAVLAVNQKDARNYIRAWHHDGTFVGTVSSGKVEAHCGGTTETAQKILAENLAKAG